MKYDRKNQLYKIKPPFHHFNLNLFQFLEAPDYPYTFIFRRFFSVGSKMNTSYSSIKANEGFFPSMVYWSLKSIISLVAVFGNGIVMWLICTRKRLHCTANWYVLSLATADFCTGLIITPSELICLWKPAMCIWPLAVRGSFYNYPISVSICCLCVLTLDRYLCVLYPLKYTRCMTSKLVVGLISSSWILPGILNFVCLFWLDAPISIQDTADKVVTILQIFLVSFLPSIFLVYAYTKILFTAIKQRRRSTEHIFQLRFNHKGGDSEHVISQRGRERSSTVKVLGFVITFFVLCWIPSLYRAICGNFLPCTVSSSVVQISRLLILLNSGMNFAVYAFLKKDIRTELCKTCRKEGNRSRERFCLMERSSRASSNDLNRSSVKASR